MSVSKRDLNLVIAASDKKLTNALKRMESNIKRSTERSSRSLSKHTKDWKAVHSMIQKVVLIAGGALSLQGLKSMISYMDEIGKRAKQIGTTAEALQELQFIAEADGVAMADFNKSLQMFSRNIGDANNGTGELLRWLKMLDISAKELSTMPLDKAFELIADKTANMADQTQRASLAAAAFGRSGGKMITMLRNGSKRLQELRQEARKVGAVIDNSLIARAEEAQTRLDAASWVIRSRLMVAFSDLIPVIVRATEKLADFVSYAAVPLGKNLGFAMQTIGAFATIMGVRWVWGFAQATIATIRTTTAVAAFNAIIKRNPVVMALGLAISAVGLLRSGNAALQGSTDSLSSALEQEKVMLEEISELVKEGSEQSKKIALQKIDEAEARLKNIEAMRSEKLEELKPRKKALEGEIGAINKELIEHNKEKPKLVDYNDQSVEPVESLATQETQKLVLKSQQDGNLALALTQKRTLNENRKGDFLDQGVTDESFGGFNDWKNRESDLQLVLSSAQNDLASVNTQINAVKPNKEEQELRAKLASLKQEIKDNESSVAKAALGSFDSRIKSLKKSNDAMKDYANLVRDVKLAVEHGKITQEQANGVLQKAHEALEYARNSLLRYADESKKASKTIGDHLVTAFERAEDAFRQFVRTGKFNFKSLVASMLEDMAVLQFKRAILSPIAAGLSGIFGGGGAFLGGGGGLFGGNPIGGHWGVEMHKGGVVGKNNKGRFIPESALHGAYKYHNGGIAGLRPSEVPAILQKGELVLQPNQLQNIKQSDNQRAPIININVDARGAVEGVAKQIDEKLKDAMPEIMEAASAYNDNKNARRGR